MTTAVRGGDAVATTTSASQILHHTSSFLSQVISQPDLRHRLLATLRRKNLSSSVKPLNIASETLEKALAATNTFIKSSSLRLAERLLLSCPETPFSSFILSLIYTLNKQPIDASLSLLNIFYLNPSLTRSELAPDLFDELFLVHLLPILQWLYEQRSSILSSLAINGCENSVGEASVVVPSSKSLSKMSGGQALELKELESSYDGVIDDNCRVFAQYFREILRNSDDNIIIKTPSLIMKKLGNVDDQLLNGCRENYDEIKTESSELKNGRQFGQIQKQKKYQLSFAVSVAANQSLNFHHILKGSL